MFKQIESNIWSFENDVKVITTNHVLKMNGAAVMGKGLAVQASKRFPKLALRYGDYIRKSEGDIKTIYYPDFNLIMFPTKYNWRDKASYTLIRKSMEELYEICINNSIKRVIMPRVGAGNGRLDWNQVKKRIIDILNCNEVEFVIAKIK